MNTTFGQLAQYANPSTAVGGRRVLAALLCAAALPVVAGCGESSCPAGSTQLGGRCIAENSLHGDGGLRPDDDASAEGADKVDARTADRDAALADAARDATSEADACMDCCESGYVIESGACVRNPCLASASEPALCDANAACTYAGAGDASCACKAGYMGDGLSCVRDGCLPEPGAAAPCAAHQECMPLSDGEPGCTCSAGYADCDADAANGCELEVDSDPSSCGACGFVCADDLACKAGACEPRVGHIGMGVVVSLFTTPDGQLLGAGAGPIIGPATQDSPTQLQHGKVSRALPYFDHVCALRPDAAGAVCWGDNTKKQLGSTNTSDTSFEITAPGRAVCAGDNHSCFAGQGGAVNCWGLGYVGEYGDGVTRDRTWAGRGFGESSSSPARNVSDAIDVVCGRLVNCALTSVGRVQCWGMDGSSAYPPEFVRDADSKLLDDAVALCAGQNHACAVRSDGRLACWGDPADGRLGAGATLPVGRNHFVTAAVSDVKAVACGSAHTCALLADGAVRCWGSGVNGALGAGDTAGQLIPTEPALPPGYQATGIFSGPAAAGYCATLTTGQVYCWGYNNQGQLGLGATSAYEAQPVEVMAWP